MVTTFYPPYNFGGDGIFVYRLSHALADRGHQVVVVHNPDAFRLLTDSGPFLGFEEHPNVERIELRSRLGRLNVVGVQQTGHPCAYAGQLRSILEDKSLDLIHFHNVSLMGAPATLKMGTAPKIYTTHEHWLVCAMHVLWKFDKEPCETRDCVRCQLAGHRPPQMWRHTDALSSALQAIDLLLAPSQFAYDKHRELGITRPMEYFPHFVPEPVPQESEAPIPDAGDRPYFLYVGRLERIKGVDSLIRAFRKFTSANLLIIGDGSERVRLETMAAGLDHVRLLGRMAPDEIAPYYRGARAVIVPSLCYEIFGLTAPEGFSYGTPAIVRGLGALPEVIERSGAGSVYGTEAELIESLQRFESDDEHQAKLSRLALEAYHSQWSKDAHLDRYETLCARIGTACPVSKPPAKSEDPDGTVPRAVLAQGQSSKPTLMPAPLGPPQETATLPKEGA